MTVPISLDVTVDPGSVGWAAAVHPAYHRISTYDDRYVWVTETTVACSVASRRAIWTNVHNLLSAKQVRTRFRLELPAPADGVRGHLALNASRYPLICLRTERPGPAAAIEPYSGIYPRWVQAQNPSTQHLLEQLGDVRAPHAAGRTLGALPHDELLDTLAPLLAEPVPVQAALAGILEADPSTPRFSELLHIARALR